MASRSLRRNVSDCMRGPDGSGSREVDLGGHAILEFHRFFPNAFFVEPDLQFEGSGRKMFQTIMTRGIRFDEVRRVQNQNGAAHMLVNFAVELYDAGFIENEGGGFFIFTISAEIESSGFGIGENVVIALIEIGEFHECADFDWNDARRKLKMFLFNFDDRAVSR